MGSLKRAETKLPLSLSKKEFAAATRTWLFPGNEMELEAASQTRKSKKHQAEDERGTGPVERAIVFPSVFQLRIPVEHSESLPS